MSLDPFLQLCHCLMERSPRNGDHEAMKLGQCCNVPNEGVPSSKVLIIGILLFRVKYQGPPCSSMAYTHDKGSYASNALGLICAQGAPAHMRSTGYRVLMHTWCTKTLVLHGHLAQLLSLARDVCNKSCDTGRMFGMSALAENASPFAFSFWVKPSAPLALRSGAPLRRSAALAEPQKKDTRMLMQSARRDF